MNKAYRWMGYLNDALYYCLLWFFVGGICTMQLFTQQFSAWLFPVLLIWYFVFIFVLKQNRMGMYLGSVLLGSACFYSYSWFVCGLGILYYLLGSYLFQMVADKKIYMRDEIKIILLVLVYATVISLFSVRLPRYATISSYGLFFLMFSVVYTIRTNVITEYEHNTSVTIKKEQNILIVNIISMVATCFCFLIRNHLIDFLMLLLLAVFYLLYFAVKVGFKCLLLITQGVFFLLSFLPFHITYKRPDEDYNPFQVIDDFLVDTREQNLPKGDDTWIKLLLIVIGLVLVFYFVRKMYYKLKEKDSDVDMSEEKEFVFDSFDLMKEVNERIHKFTGNQQLSKTRKQYIQAVNKCIEENYQWKASFTPNEYLRSIDRKSVIQKHRLDTLTKAYMEERYRGES